MKLNQNPIIATQIVSFMDGNLTAYNLEEFIEFYAREIAIKFHKEHSGEDISKKFDEWRKSKEQ